MTFNNPRSQERDNQNSLRKFPFSDAAVCGNGSFVIPPGAIIDAQLYVPGREASPVWLTEVDTDGKLHFADSDGEFAETSAAATANTAVPVTFTGDGGPLPGGVIVFGAASDVSALVSAGGQTFTQEQAELASAAVTHLGLPGVSGFKLDDGNVISGAVKFKGANGAAVSTYTVDGVNYLRISAIGKTVETTQTTGFITSVVAESDNSNFTVSPDALSVSSIRPNRVINICATGVSSVQDDDLNADQENTCSVVRKKVGSVPSQLSSVSTDCTCSTAETVTRTITLTGGTTNHSPTTFSWTVGTALGSVTPPTPPTGKKFTGYFDAEQSASGDKKMYYRHDGTGVGKFTASSNVTLYAHWIDATSTATVSFDGYGTLHLAAPSTSDYSNPVEVSGIENPIPVVREVSDDTLVAGGTEALAEIVLHPSVPNGEVHIGIRGLKKAYSS